MKIGITEHNGEHILVMPLGARWINVTAADRDYNRHVENRDAPPLRTVQSMIDRGLINRSYYRRICEFAQRHGRLTEYSFEGDPHFLLPHRPGKIVAVGRNYRAHVQELGNDMPTEPTLFAKTPTACIGPEEPIVIEDWYGRVDHEGELAVVIGKRAKAVPRAEAQQYIAGYTLLNDVTAREIQKADIAKGGPWFRAKNLDTFCPLGPVVVFPEVLGWPVETDIEVRVNGEVRQQGNTELFMFDLPWQIEAITKFMTLEPGDVIATGTPAGVSPMLPGDVVEVLNPEIGVLRNPVVGGAGT